MATTLHEYSSNMLQYFNWFLHTALTVFSLTMDLLQWIVRKVYRRSCEVVTLGELEEVLGTPEAPIMVHVVQRAMMMDPTFIRKWTNFTCNIGLLKNDIEQIMLMSAGLETLGIQYTLETWLRTLGPLANYKHLIEILEKLKFQQVADTLKEKFHPNIFTSKSIRLKLGSNSPQLVSAYKRKRESLTSIEFVLLYNNRKQQHVTSIAEKYYKRCPYSCVWAFLSSGTISGSLQCLLKENHTSKNGQDTDLNLQVVAKAASEHFSTKPWLLLILNATGGHSVEIEQILDSFKETKNVPFIIVSSEDYSLTPLSAFTEKVDAELFRRNVLENITNSITHMPNGQKDIFLRVIKILHMFAIPHRARINLQLFYICRDYIGIEITNLNSEIVLQLKKLEIVEIDNANCLVVTNKGFTFLNNFQNVVTNDERFKNDAISDVYCKLRQPDPTDYDDPWYWCQTLDEKLLLNFWYTICEQGNIQFIKKFRRFGFHLVARSTIQTQGIYDILKNVYGEEGQEIVNLGVMLAKDERNVTNEQKVVIMRDALRIAKKNKTSQDPYKFQLLLRAVHTHENTMDDEVFYYDASSTPLQFEDFKIKSTSDIGKDISRGVSCSEVVKLLLQDPEVIRRRQSFFLSLGLEIKDYVQGNSLYDLGKKTDEDLFLEVLCIWKSRNPASNATIDAIVEALQKNAFFNASAEIQNCFRNGVIAF